VNGAYVYTVSYDVFSHCPASLAGMRLSEGDVVVSELVHCANNMYTIDRCTIQHMYLVLAPCVSSLLPKKMLVFLAGELGNQRHTLLVDQFCSATADGARVRQSSGQGCFHGNAMVTDSTHYMALHSCLVLIP